MMSFLEVCASLCKLLKVFATFLFYFIAAFILLYFNLLVRFVVQQLYTVGV